MFCSYRVGEGSVLFERAAQSRVEFEVQLQHLKAQQLQFSALPVTERTALLSAFAQRLSDNRDTLAKMVCEEVGRCLRECEAEIDKSIELIRYYVKLAPELLAHKTIATQASLSQVRFEPLGVVLAVMPWNYPVWQVLRFAVPALCAGNACWVKPAPSVARVTAQLFEWVGEDLPFQVAWLDHDDVLLAIEETDALAFTGSDKTGRILAAHAGKHIKKTVLENIPFLATIFILLSSKVKVPIALVPSFGLITVAIHLPSINFKFCIAIFFSSTSIPVKIFPFFIISITTPFSVFHFPEKLSLDF